MQKFEQIFLYFSILIFYNLTTIYTAEVHHHPFSLNDNESCPAYVISIGQFADTFPFSTNCDIKISEEGTYLVQRCEPFINFEFQRNLTTRAPPTYI